MRNLLLTAVAIVTFCTIAYADGPAPDTNPRGTAICIQNANFTGGVFHPLPCFAETQFGLDDLAKIMGAAKERGLTSYSQMKASNRLSAMVASQLMETAYGG